MPFLNDSSFIKNTAVSIVLLVLFVILNIQLCSASNCEQKLYENYSLFACYPENEDQVKYLHAMEKNKYLNVHIWNRPILPGKQMQVMVKRIHDKLFQDKNAHFKLKTKGLVENVQRVFDEQVVKEGAFNPHKNRWSYFHMLSDIYKYLNEIAKNYSTIAKLETIGKSSEDRDIVALSIKNPVKPYSNKVFMEAGAHGNEYLGPTFILYFIEQLLTDGYEPLKTIKYDYNWYFIPVLNPDGYEYSQTVDRLWIKNRRKLSDKATGVNLNRNFGYKFGTYDTSEDPQNDVYQGPNEFSESETQALRDFVTRKRDGLMFYLSFHGYGQSFIMPYSDSVKFEGGNFYELRIFARKAVAKIKAASGRTYKVDHADKVLGYKYSGDSASWVKRKFRTPYVYTILGRDDNFMGYALPRDQIFPFCTEMLAGTTELLSSTPKYLGLRSLMSSALNNSCDFALFIFFVVTNFVIIE